MPALRRAALGALAAAACLAQAAGEAPAEAPKPRTYALVSAVGDQFQYVRRRPSVGSHLEPFRRFNAKVPNGALDAAVLRGLDRTVAASDPASQRVFIALNPAEIEAVRPAERERIAIGKVVSALESMKQRSGWDRIFVVTPHYRHGEMQGLGSKLGGIGVFIQPLERGRARTLDLDGALEGLDDPDTVTPGGKPSRSYTYVAPFFYTKLWVIDPKTLQVIDTEERFDYQKIHDPTWTAVDVARNFTPEQLAGQVEKFVERASSRALREAIGVVTVTDPKAVGGPKAPPPAAAGR
jgi:hypothetical protein